MALNDKSTFLLFNQTLQLLILMQASNNLYRVVNIIKTKLNHYHKTTHGRHTMITQMSNETFSRKFERQIG